MKPEAGEDLTFGFDEGRTVQAAAVLLREAGGQENYTTILKELYLADRRSLLETGHPITGSTFVSMAKGPVLSEVYNCIKGEAEEEGSIWDRHIRTNGYEVELIEDPGDDRLSDYEVAILRELAEKYRRMHYSYLITVVHQLPEWKHPRPAKVASLPAAEIFRVSGESEDTIDKQARRVAYLAAVDKLIQSS